MSLRARLLVVVAVVVAAVTISALVVIGTQQHFLSQQVDDQLRVAAARVVRLPAFANAPNTTPRTPPTGTRPVPLNDRGRFISDTWIGEIVGNRVVERVAPRLGNESSPRVGVTQATAAARSGRTFDAPATSGSSRFRMRAVRRSDGRVVVLGVSLRRVDAAVSRLRLALILGASLIAAIVVLLAWWVWRLGLRPVRRVTLAADAVAAGDLDHRVDVPTSGSEASRLASAFNEMVDARQQADERLRRFVSDASHELRTPLTSIRGYAELHRRGGLPDREAIDDAMRRIGAEATRMHALVEDLLLLARLDEGRPLAHDPVDLGVALREIASDARVVDPKREVEVEVEDPLLVTGDDDRLRQVLSALVTNALVHTTGAVRIRGYRNGNSTAVIDVSDEGPGMEPEVSTRVFDRFFRAAPGRSRDHGGSGLGLAIVSSIVHAHGGKVEVDSTPQRGSTFRVELPA